MGKWKNIVKRFKEEQVKKQPTPKELVDPSITVLIEPNAYQAVLTISRDGKTATLKSLLPRVQAPALLVQHGLMMIHNQIVGEMAIAAERQKQLSEQDPERN